jgi:probable rRNA maturation factor
MRENNQNTQSISATLYLQDNFFAVQQRPCPVNEVTLSQYVQRWLGSLSGTLEPASEYELSLRLTDDAEMQSLNACYRHQDKPTDVLAFAELDVDFPDFAKFHPDESIYLGDIVISIDTAQHQAEQQQHSLTVELLWLLAHGVLHLLGWDHPTEARLQEMLTQQQQFLNLVGVSIFTEFTEN